MPTIRFSLSAPALALFASLGCHSLGEGLHISLGMNAPGFQAKGRSSEGTAESLRAYALVKDDQAHSVRMSAERSDYRDFEALRRRVQGPFLWVRLGRQDYLLREAATLAKVHGVFAAEEALDSQERTLDQEEAALDARQEKLEAQLEALDERLEALDEEEEEEDEASTANQAKVAEKRRALEKEHKALEREQQQLEKELEKLSHRQEALSQQQERASREAERALERLVQEAVRSGLATPVDRDGSPAKR